MSTELPHGWREVPFGRLLSREKRTCGSDELPILSVTKDGIVLQLDHFKKQVASEDTSGYLRVRRGEVVTSALNLWMGGIDTQVLVDEGIVSPAYKVYRRVSDELDHEFMRHLIRSPVMMGLYREVSQQGASIVRRNVDFDRLHTSPIPLPPLTEQKKIAAILSSVDEAIRANDAVIEQTLRVKEGLLQELLTRGIGHTEFRETEIGPLPVEWELVELGELADVRSGIAKSSGRQLRDPIEVPYLRVANVQDGYVDLREVKNIAIEREDIERYRLMSGDVLMNEGGDIDKLGRGDVWRGQIDPCVHQNHVFSVRCGVRLRPEYLSFLAESSYGKRYFLYKGKQTTNLASINKTQLRAFPVPLPTIAEQDTIIDRLMVVRSVVDANLANVGSLQRLKSGLLQDLLTGKVRVTP